MDSAHEMMGATPTRPHGQKRPPADDLENEQRLTKRFNLLNIEHNGKLYQPVQLERPQPRRTRSNAISESNESMQVDKSRDRVFIHNLDDELSDAESEEEKLVFLADIEKQLSKIPPSVLNRVDEEQRNNEMILYGVPNSISLPTEHDSVRRAIIESRQRLRERQLEIVSKDTSTSTTAGMLGLSPRFQATGIQALVDDGDLMDIG